MSKMNLQQGEQELISVIVPVYQVEKYLVDTIESILCQTYSNLELLLIDDGSKDGSGRLCDTYAQKDQRVRVWHQENQGVSAARNAGMEQARGTYITFIDSDDLVKPDYLEVLHRGLTAHGADICACNFVSKGNGVAVHDRMALVKQPRLITDREVFFRDMATREELYWANACGKLFRAAFIRSCRFRRLRHGEDGTFMYDVLTLGPVMYLDTYEGYYYVVREDSASVASAAYDTVRLRDELEMDYHRWKNLPQVSADIHASMLLQFAVRIHNLAYAQVVLDTKELTGLLRERAREAAVFAKQLPSRMRLNVTLLAYVPWLYRLLVQLKRALQR